MATFNYDEPTHWDESQDRCILLKKFFIDFAMNKTVKQLNIFFVIFHSFVYLLQLTFIFIHVKIDVVARYSPMLSINLCGIIIMALWIVLEKDIQDIYTFFASNAWSTDCAGQEAFQTIDKWAFRVNCVSVIVCTMIFGGTLIMMPVFGDESELFLCIEVFNAYFKTWRSAPYIIFFASGPLCVYAGIRFIFIFIYILVTVQAQILLINRHLLQISEDLDEEMDDYWEVMYKRLRFCVKHHVAMKQVVWKIQEGIEFIIPLLVLMAIMCLASSIFLILNYFQKMSYILKVRLAYMALGFTSLTVFSCKSCQDLIDESTQIYHILTKSPWYQWGVKNEKLVLIFVTNSFKPIRLHVGGLTVDYGLAFTIMRTSYSIATLLFYFRK